jgi:hypothetical protein
MVTGADVVINPTHFAYGFYGVNASGQIKIQGGVRSSAGYVDGTTHGVLAMGLATAGAATTFGAGRMHPLQIDLSGNLRTTLTAGSLTAFISGTATVSGVVSAVGMAPHGSAATANPVRVGLKAAALGSAAPTAADTSASDWYANRNGVAFMIGGDPNLQFREFELSAASGFFVIATAATGSKIVVVEAGVTLAAAATANAAFRMAIASANGATGLNAVLTATAQSTVEPAILRHFSMPPGAGLVRGNGAGILAVGADGASIVVSAGAPGGQRWNFWVVYYTVPS